MTKKITITLLAGLLSFCQGWSQSNPTPQTLPYTQSFGTSSFSSMPAGMAAWSTDNNKGSQSAAESGVPGSNITLAAQTATTGTGGVFGYATSGNGRVYIQQSGNATAGTAQVALAINTGSATSVDVSYQLEMINPGGGAAQTLGIELMYHSGSSSSTSWIAVPSSVVTMSATSFSTQTYTCNITGLTPSTNYQFRWVTWKFGTGGGKGVGIDNISVTSAGSSTVTIAGQDPNTPSAVNWALGSLTNQFYWASLSPTGGNVTLSSVTANMSGSYAAADISTNGLKLYYSSDFTFVPSGDVLLKSLNSSKSGATETVTWSSLTQTLATGSTGYIYATADIAATASVGATLAGSFTSDANIVFTPTVGYGSNTYGAVTNKTFAALPTNPSTFAVNCSSEAKVSINMNAPTTGTVLVFANTTGTFTDPTGAGSSFTGANLNYGSAANYPAVGGRLVYSGSGANFAVSGLAIGQNYSFKAYSYSGSTWSSGTSVINGTATTQPVSGVVLTPSSGQLTLSWSNPGATSCYNNVIIIARQASAVEAAVSKANFDGLVSDADFTGANAVWTSNSSANDVNALTAGLVGTANTNFLVYKGTGSFVNITGLTNGTAYYFRIFTVDGSSSAKWSAATDVNGIPSLPGYYWNGGSISALPANGGTGTWSVTSGWRQPSASGAQTSWADGNSAVFAGAAGVVTLDADRSASSYVFNTSSYTLQTTSGTGITLTGPITIGTNNQLVLAPNPSGSSNGVISIGSVNGSGTAGITIYGNQTGSSASARINIATSNATVNVPTNIVTSSGTSVAGYVSTTTGAAVNGNITNNSAMLTCLGATSGFDITLNGVISGTSGLQFSAGATGGAGDVILNSANTYSGGTFFNAASTGEITLGINDALPTSGDVTMSSASSGGGVFNLNGYNQTIGNLTNNFTIGSIINNSAVSNSTLTVTQTTAQSFGLAIKDGTKKVALVKNGASILTLTNNTHAFSGGLTLNAGELRFNPSASLTSLSVCPVAFNGGTLGTSGIGTGRILKFSTLNVKDNSNISLNTSGTHTITFAASNAETWTASKTLVITGWQGVYTSATGSSGTAAKIIVGSNATALTTAQLAQIKFFNGTTNYDAMLLANGELVPYLAPITTQLRTYYCGYTAQSFGEFIAADSVATANYYRFQLVNAANSYTQTFTNSSGYPYLALYLFPGIAYNTTYTTTVAWSVDGVTWSSYGSPCSLTTPVSEITQITASDCGVTYTSWSTLINADPASGATRYRFQLANTALGYSQTFINTNKNFNFNSFTGLVGGTTYSASVAVELFGVWNPYGPSCNVTTPIVPTTSLLPQYCGYTPSSYSELMTAEYQVGSSFRFKLENVGLGYNQTFVNTNRNVNLAQYTGLIVGTTYSLSVSVFYNGAYGPYGNACQITIPAGPTTSLMPQYCGYTPSSYSELMTAEYQLGSSFRFKLENVGLGYSQTFVNTNRNVNLIQYTGLTAGTTYSLSVSVFYDGAYGPYGTACQITVPSSIPTTSVVPGNCGYTPSSYSELMNVNAVTGASNYEFKLENAALSYVQTFTNVNRNFNFAVYSGLSTSTTYTISARVQFMGTWGPYGPACTVTTPASAIILAGGNGTSNNNSPAFRQDQATGLDKAAAQTAFNAIAYPNPFNESFNLNLLSYQVNESVTIRVYDGMGKLVESHSVMPSAVNSLTIGADYAKGLYNIILSQSGSSKAIKVVRQ